jgi:large subunit ribosomal protein L4
MNKKERRLALLSILSSKLKENKLLVLNSIEFSEIKTKNMVQVLNSIPYEKSVLLAIPSKDEVIEKSSANVPNMKTLLVDYLNIADLLKYNTLVLLKDSLDKVNALNK